MSTPPPPLLPVIYNPGGITVETEPRIAVKEKNLFIDLEASGTTNTTPSNLQQAPFTCSREAGSESRASNHKMEKSTYFEILGDYCLLIGKMVVMLYQCLDSMFTDLTTLRADFKSFTQKLLSNSSQVLAVSPHGPAQEDQEASNCHPVSFNGY